MADAIGQLLAIQLELYGAHHRDGGGGRAEDAAPQADGLPPGSFECHEFFIGNPTLGAAGEHQGFHAQHGVDGAHGGFIGDPTLRNFPVQKDIERPHGEQFGNVAPMTLFYGRGDDPGPSFPFGRGSAGIEFTSGVDDGMEMRHTQFHEGGQPILPGGQVGGEGKAGVQWDGRFPDLAQRRYEPGMGSILSDSREVRLPGAVFHQQL